MLAALHVELFDEGWLGGAVGLIPRQGYAQDDHDDDAYDDDANGDHRTQIVSLAGVLERVIVEVIAVVHVHHLLVS